MVAAKNRCPAVGQVVAGDANGPALRVFVYPRSAGDPFAEEVRRSFRLIHAGFVSALGRVEGELYFGRTSAGGRGERIALPGGQASVAAFADPCGFILQLAGGKVTRMEADRDVDATIGGKSCKLAAFIPRASEVPMTPE